MVDVAKQKTKGHSMRYKKTFPAVILIFLFSFGCEKNPTENTAILPEVTTTNITNITGTTAQCGGTVISDGGATITACGVCWSTGQTPTISDNKTNNGTGDGSFTSDLTDLIPGTTYYVRAYATNSIGTGYGKAISFTTLNLPVLITAEVSDITSTSAKSGGTISSDGGSTITARGVCWSTNPNPTIVNSITLDGNGDGSFTSYISDLSLGTTYYVRAYATNSVGTGYGNALSFTTLSIPVLITTEVSDITSTSVKCGGTISSSGGAIVTACGVCWSTNNNPTIDNEKTIEIVSETTFSSDIEDLTPGSTYYIRAYATNSIGTGYGDEVSFKTEEEPTTGTVTDMDGNIYQTVKIGNQWWMAENLKVTHYRNGEPIPYVNDNTIWSGLTTGAYCSYNNSAGYLYIYGGLYNWFASIDSRGISPMGWHIPTSDEWQEIITYLGGAAVAGGKMKDIEIDYTGNEGWYWAYPNTGASNESGFSALPGGLRSGNGIYANRSGYTYFWSATELNNIGTISYSLYCESSAISQRENSSKKIGMSIRCIKDQ